MPIFDKRLKTTNFMKKLLGSLLMALTTVGWAQSLPFDFESTTSGMLGYDGATFTIVSNPSTTGNASVKAAKIVKVNAGDLWAGGKITNVTSLNFSSAATSVLSMKVYTTEPVGTVIKVKLENPYTSEVDAITTLSGAWETLKFDFGIPAPTGSADLVIMPQPFTAGGGNTFFIDDVKQVAGVITTPRPSLPITFESGTTGNHFFDFESAIMTSVANPDIDADNNSAKVGKIVRYLGAPFGGSKIKFSNMIDFASHPVITMKVWTSAPIGTNVTLKAEKAFWGEERSVTTTKSEEWETLSFSFTNAQTDMPTLTFLFDFAAGTTYVGDGTAASTFYFDDVKFANVALSNQENNFLNPVVAYPNPTSDQWTLYGSQGKMESVQVYSLSGQLMGSFKSRSNEISIDASAYAPGFYAAKIRSSTGDCMIRLVKQ